jgi:predicted  nucleic acid-binding Zn-ribbon protein
LAVLSRHNGIKNAFLSFEIRERSFWKMADQKQTEESLAGARRQLQSIEGMLQDVENKRRGARTDSEKEAIDRQLADLQGQMRDLRNQIAGQDAATSSPHSLATDAEPPRAM